MAFIFIFYSLSLLPSICNAVSINVALQDVNVYKEGDIVQILSLKKKQNESLQRIAQQMNNSYGIILSNPTHRERNRTQLRLKWYRNYTVTAIIKEKYVIHRPFPNIYIHDLSRIKEDPYFESYVINFMRILLKDKNKDVINEALYHVSITQQNENVINGNLLHLMMITLDKAQKLDATNADQWVKYFLDIPGSLTKPILREAIKQLYTEVKSKQYKWIKKIESLCDALFERDKYYFDILFNETTMINDDCLRNEKWIELCMTLAQMKNGSKQMIKKQIGALLTPKENKNFWIAFRKAIVNAAYLLIDRAVQESYFTEGIFIRLHGFTFDIVNTYLRKSVHNGHDLHVITVFNVDGLQIGNGTKEIADNLVLSAENNHCRLRLQLADCIPKLIVHYDTNFDYK